jgi:hypothetical protein
MSVFVSEKSLEWMFLDKGNVTKISNAIGRDAKVEMKKWAETEELDDYESVSLNYDEMLVFVNKKFIKEHKKVQTGISLAEGQKYPKHIIYDNTQGFGVDDWRSMDAQYTQVVQRSNSNFRYRNSVKTWETSLYKRHYDRDNHAEGLGDVRELRTIQRGYDMGKIHLPNEFTSSDSLMYSY